MSLLDYYLVSELFTPEERQTQAAVREFLEAEAAPYVSEWWEKGTFPVELVPRMGELGLFGANLPLDGCAPTVSNLAYGLIMYELERIDSGLRSFASVQAALVMYPIHAYGSDDMRQRYLLSLSKGETIGCFALTESEGGSDPGAMRTRARNDGDSYVLDGSKMWITNGEIADIALVWAKDDKDVVRGFVVPTHTPGFVANPIPRKMSMRMSSTSELTLRDVRVPATPDAAGRKGARSRPLLPNPGAVRDRVGSAGGDGGGVYGSAGVRPQSRYLREAHRLAPTRARKARRHAGRPHQRAPFWRGGLRASKTRASWTTPRSPLRSVRTSGLP